MHVSDTVESSQPRSAFSCVRTHWLRERSLRAESIVRSRLTLTRVRSLSQPNSGALSVANAARLRSAGTVCLPRYTLGDARLSRLFRELSLLGAARQTQLAGSALSFFSNTRSPLSNCTIECRRGFLIACFLKERYMQQLWWLRSGR